MKKTIALLASLLLVLAVLPAQAAQREAYLLPGISEPFCQRLFAFIHLFALPGI